MKLLNISISPKRGLQAGHKSSAFQGITPTKHVKGETLKESYGPGKDHHFLVLKNRND